MDIRFKYNIFQDYLRGLDTLTRRRSYLNTRSVVSFRLFLPIKTFLLKSELIYNIKKLWDLVEKDIIKRLEENDVEIHDTQITVFIVSMGVEGKYNEISRKIWARYYKCGGEIEFITTIVHELVHVYYADSKKVFDDVEDQVDDVIEKIKMKDLISKKYLKKYSIGQDELAPNELE